MRCQKIPYTTKKKAIKAKDRIAATRKNDKRECAVYYCVFCDSWHTTSVPRDEWAARR